MMLTCPACKARLMAGYKAHYAGAAPCEGEPEAAEWADWQPWDEWIDAAFFVRREGRLIAVLDDGSEVEVRE